MTDWTLRQTLFFLIGSTLCTLLLFFSVRTLWNRSASLKQNDPAYRITTLIQTGPEKEPLKTAYLAELLGLSINKPQNLYAFDIVRAEKKLLASPLIRTAKIARRAPNALYIDYEVRHPVAILADYQNVAIDREGYLFPLAPFFSPKELPEIYLGIPPFGEPEDSFGRSGGRWQTPLKNRYLNLAFEVLQTLEGTSGSEGIRIKRIDVSNAYAPTLGMREIVLQTEEELLFTQGGRSARCVFPKILRLASKEYAQQLSNFLAYRKQMMEDYRKQLTSIPENGRFAPRIVDLRIPQLAFVENQS